MRTFVNSRAMALTLALETIDDQVRRPQRPRQRRFRRTRDVSATDAGRPVSLHTSGQSSAGGSPATSRAQAACSRRAQRSGTRPVRIPVIAWGSLAAM